MALIRRQVLGQSLAPVPTGIPDEIGLWHNTRTEPCEDKTDITHDLGFDPILKASHGLIIARPMIDSIEGQLCLNLLSQAFHPNHSVSSLRPVALIQTEELMNV